MSRAPIIRIAVALLRDHAGRALLVRKRGTRTFMQPGGKIDPGETPAEALRRELHEELRLILAPEALSPLGHFGANAANEIGHRVEAEAFAVTWSGEVTPAAEIEEIRWIDPLDPPDLPIAELSRQHILPLAGQRT